MTSGLGGKRVVAPQTRAAQARAGMKACCRIGTGWMVSKAEALRAERQRLLLQAAEPQKLRHGRAPTCPKADAHGAVAPDEGASEQTGTAPAGPSPDLHRRRPWGACRMRSTASHSLARRHFRRQLQAPEAAARGAGAIVRRPLRRRAPRHLWLPCSPAATSSPLIAVQPQFAMPPPPVGPKAAMPPTAADAANPADMAPAVAGSPGAHAPAEAVAQVHALRDLRPRPPVVAAVLGAAGCHTSPRPRVDQQAGRRREDHFATKRIAGPGPAVAALR